jgi:CheY-like chemotaxis protein
MASEIVVLVAEDEALISLSIRDALEDGGYAVVTASSGEDAVEVLEGDQGRLSGLVTDIRMGSGPNGWDLAHRARQLNANIAVVYVTADSAEQRPSSGVPKSVLLQKPFAEAQLVTALSNLLNDAG